MEYSSGSDPDVVVIHNARIYSSGEEDYTWMTFSRETGRILTRGRVDPRPVLDHTRPENTVDAGGRRVLPGLHDSHIHLGSYSLQLCSLNLHDCGSISEMQQRLRDYLAGQEASNKDGSGDWVVGNHWEQDKLGRYPTREDLDEVCPDRPVAIFRVCIHIVVVNSKALELMGITKDTAVPSDMHFDLYPEGHRLAGEPSGVLREAVGYIRKEFLTPSTSRQVDTLRTGIRRCLEFGVTSAHCLEERAWAAYGQLADAGELPLRVFYVPYYKDYRDGPDFPLAGEARGPMLSCDRVKLFTDGALGPCTAALSHAYRGTDNKGMLLHTQEDLTRLCAEATSRGYRLEIHGIGDRAADATMKALKDADVAPEKRPILVHCQVLRKDVIDKMKVQGVIGSLQPQFVLTDSRWLDQMLPDELSDYLYPWKTLLDTGVACCGGSDAPVESPEPLLGIYDAIFRPSDVRGENNKKCFRPHEKLTVTEAIDLYTKGGAYATMKEDTLGQLRPGFQADFVILDSPRDVCDYPEEFCRAKPAQVWVAGHRKL